MCVFSIIKYYACVYAYVCTHTTPLDPPSSNPPNPKTTHHENSGTSSSDGFGIAWAVAERLCSSPATRCRTLFATHFHELTEMEGCVILCGLVVKGGRECVRI